MKTLLSPHYVAQAVTQTDLIIASLAWGFTIGFGWLTTWTAVKQTTRIWRRRGRRVFSNAYVVMIWLEILVCLIFAIICFLHLLGIIPPRFVWLLFGQRLDAMLMLGDYSFAFYFCIRMSKPFSTMHPSC
ncbi:hypothetical protein AUP68_07152 [Ilyonectria robusta]